MNQQKLEAFLDIYRTCLEKCATSYPDEYTFPIEQLPIVFEKIKQAIINDTYNKYGRAFEATCKALGIKHTYKAINEYLERKV